MYLRSAASRSGRLSVGSIFSMQPGPLFGVADVHEFDGEGAAVGLPELADEFSDGAADAAAKALGG